MHSPVEHMHYDIAGKCKWCGQLTKLFYLPPFNGFHFNRVNLPFCNLSCWKSYFS